MAGLFSTQNALATRPQFTEPIPEQPVDEQDAILRHLAKVAMELHARRGTLPPSIGARKLMDGQQYATEADATAIEPAMVQPDDLYGFGLGKAMYVPLSKAAKAILDKVVKEGAQEIPEGLPRVFSALHDKMPRVEIDDSAAFFHGRGSTAAGPDININGPRDTLGNNLDHDLLYNEMPDLKDVGFRRSPDYNKAASYDPNSDTITLGDQHGYDVLMHEIQHPIQERGGFARGGSPEAMVAELEKLAKQADAERNYRLTEKLRGQQGIARWDDGRQAYNNLAGEIESRDTAARMGMNALDRARTQPYTGMQVRPDGSFGPAYDIGGNIPLEDYIVRREGGNALYIPDEPIGDETLYHGTGEFRGGWFDNQMKGAYTGSGGAEEAFFLSNRPEVANTYAEKAPRTSVLEVSRRVKEEADGLLKTREELLMREKPDWNEVENINLLTDEKKALSESLSSLASYKADDNYVWRINDLVKYSGLSQKEADKLKNIGGMAVIPARVQYGKQMVVDAGGKIWHELPKSMSEYIKEAKANGYDSVTFKNIYDANKSYMGEDGLSDVTAVFDADRIVSKFDKRIK